MANVKRDDYGKIAKIYNESGSKATLEYIQQNYGIMSPRGVLMRLKKAKGYSYDPVNDKIITATKTEESIFMGIDELCNQMATKEVPTIATTPMCVPAFSAQESLYKELIEEKLLELIKYIKLIRHLNTIFIDKTALNADGFQINIL